MSHVLILAALPQEADALWPGVGRVSMIRQLPVRTLAQAGLQIGIAVTGIGKVNAALACGRLAEGDTRHVLISGTCGRIAADDAHAHLASPRQPFWISHAVQHDYGARHAQGFVPYRGGAWPIGAAGPLRFMPMPDPGLGLPHAGIVSGDVFLQCPDVAATLAARHDAALIDMEVAAIAQAAEAMGLPWAAIKAVTDDANSESDGDFMANVARAARSAAEAIERLVPMLA